MFRKLFNKIGYWLIDGQDRTLADQPVEINPSRYGSMGVAISKSSGSSPRAIDGNGMNFIVFSATGGKVIQFSTYDPTRDRHNTRLYIVTDKDDLGEEIAQIITRESLSN